VGKDKGLKNSGLQKNKRATPGDWLTAGEHTGHSWKVWSERVELIRSCRFTLDGDILGFQSSHEQQDGIPHGFAHMSYICFCWCGIL
jgi:RNA polymerase II-associated protein 1